MVRGLPQHPVSRRPTGVENVMTNDTYTENVSVLLTKDVIP